MVHNLYNAGGHKIFENIGRVIENDKGIQIKCFSQKFSCAHPDRKDRAQIRGLG